jgi:hypothetical protein
VGSQNENMFFFFKKIIFGEQIPTYLKMKMNKMSKEKKMATLSMVRSMTNNCRLKFGMNRTNFSIRSSLNVLNTDNPELVVAPSRMNA